MYRDCSHELFLSNERINFIDLIVEKYEKMLSQREYGELAGRFRKQIADIWILP